MLFPCPEWPSLAPSLDRPYASLVLKLNQVSLQCVPWNLYSRTCNVTADGDQAWGDTVKPNPAFSGGLILPNLPICQEEFKDTKCHSGCEATEERACWTPAARQPSVSQREKPREKQTHQSFELGHLACSCGNRENFSFYTTCHAALH